MMNRMIAALTAILLLAIMACRPLPTHTPTSSTISMPPPTGQADPNTTPEPEHRVYLPSVSKGYTPHLEISCLNGPVQNYVNDDIVLEVTYGGEPVEGAIVHFAGFEKHTGKDGKAVFNIDMAGPFKARVEKPGYEDASTLLWVFPEGNEKFPIRSTKSVSDPEQWGDIDCAGRMAGFNFARIKAYYTYDEEGNVYPIIITLGEAERLSDEATRIIQELYDDEVPRYDLWIRVPDDVFYENLEWMIGKAKDWGFNVYLLGEMLPPSVVTGHPEGKPSLELDEEAIQRYLEQRQEEALKLAEFAEKQGVDLFDPYGSFMMFPSEQFSLYKESLLEIRERFSGELVTWMIGALRDCINGNAPLEYDYSGLDYIFPWFGCHPGLLTTDSPSKWKDAIQKYLDFAEHLGDKYGVKVLPGYIASFEYGIDNDEVFNEFMSKFDSPENARIWFIKSVFDEVSRREVAGVDAHPLWFFERLYSMPGVGAKEDAYQKFSWWETKRPLNTVASYLIHPWNEEAKNALRTLQHARLAADSITTRSSDPSLVHRVSTLMGEASEAYERGDYDIVYEITREVLGQALKIGNPLGIVVDGKENEWRDIDPVYFNPSKAFPWFNLIFCYGGEMVKNITNLKLVYAANDAENLYLMLKFDELPKQAPYINIDISGEWSHQNGEEFRIVTHGPHDSMLWTQEYEGFEWPDPEHSGSKLADLECAYGDVIELKIPLELIKNPEKINLEVWYPWMAPWGDMKVDIVKWYENTR